MLLRLLALAACLSVSVAPGGLFAAHENFLVLADVGSSGTVWTVYNVAGAMPAPVVLYSTPRPGRDPKDHLAVGDGKSNNNWADCGNEGTSQLATIANEQTSLNTYWINTRYLFTSEQAGCPSLWSECRASPDGQPGAGNCGYGSAQDLWNDLAKLRWFGRATAGMRELSENSAKMDKLQIAMTDMNLNPVRSSDLMIISGATEGIFGFKANVDQFGPRGLTEQNAIYVEQGGASMQIVFAVPCTHYDGASTDVDRGGQYPPRLGPNSPGKRRMLSLKKSIDSALQPELLQTETASTLAKTLAKARGYIKLADKQCYFSESFMGYGGDELFGLVFNSNPVDVSNVEKGKCLNEGATVTSVGPIVTLTVSGPKVSEFDMTDESFTTPEKFPWVREAAFIGHRQGTLADRTVTGSAAPDDATKVQKIADCKAVIKTVTETSGKEMRGWSSGDQAPAPNGVYDGVDFSERWARIQGALAAAQADPDFAKTGVFYATPTNTNNCQAGTAAGGGCTLAELITLVKVVVDGNVKYYGTGVMIAALENYIHEKLLALTNANPALSFVGSSSMSEWTNYGAGLLAQGTPLKFADDNTVGEKFIFDSRNAPGPQPEPEMRPLTLT